LIICGFKERYSQWIWHGENIKKINVETSRIISNAESEGENLDSATIVLDDSYGENINLDDLMNEVTEYFVYIPEIFKILDDESNMLIFPGCTMFTKIRVIFKLYNLKAKNCWSDKSFTSLLQLIGEMLPENNELPNSTYKVKKLFCPLSMKVERIHACPNDCILYRNEYSEMNRYPKCKASQYKLKDDQALNENDDETNKSKKPTSKVLWYLTIILRIECLFSNERDAKLLRWHAECKKKKMTT
jgi:hypothetical protein